MIALDIIGCVLIGVGSYYLGRFREMKRTIARLRRMQAQLDWLERTERTDDMGDC